MKLQISDFRDRLESTVLGTWEVLSAFQRNRLNKEMLNNLNKWKDTQCSCVRRHNIIKMTALAKTNTN